MATKKDKEVSEGEIVSEESAQGTVVRRGEGRLFLGIILLFLGGAMILENFFPEVNFSHNFWPLALIVFGLFLIFRSLR